MGFKPRRGRKYGAAFDDEDKCEIQILLAVVASTKKTIDRSTSIERLERGDRARWQNSLGHEERRKEAREIARPTSSLTSLFPPSSFPPPLSE